MSIRRATAISVGGLKQVQAPRLAGIRLLELLRNVGQFVGGGAVDVAGAQELEQARAREGGVAVRGGAGVVVAGGGAGATDQGRELGYGVGAWARGVAAAVRRAGWGLLAGGVGAAVRRAGWCLACGAGGLVAAVRGAG